VRILAIILTVIVLVLGAALIGPSFVDWNKYKSQITEQVKTASGYDVQLNGDLSLAVLPSPRVTIREAVIAAPSPVKERTLIAVEEATVSVALLPLLEKRVVVEDVRLVKPDIRLEINQQGGQSWIVEKVSQGGQAAAEIAGAAADVASDSADSAMKAISLDSVKIEDGRIQFVNYQTGASQLAEHLNVNLKADSLFGPYDAVGDVVYGGNKITYEAKTSAIDAGDDVQVNAKLGLPDKNASVTFDGVAGKVVPFNTQGEVRVTLDKLENLAAVPAPLQGKTTLQGMITANEQKASIRDVTFQIGKLAGAGALDVGGIKDRNPLAVTGRFDLKDGLNIDELMKKAGGSASSKTGAEEGQNAKSDTPVPATLSFPFPLTLDISVNAPELAMNGQSLKGVTLTAAKQGATMAVALKANDLPGGGQVDAKGQLRYASFSINSGGGITYSDPDLSFEAKGRANQLPTLLRAALPDQRDNAALEAFKTAEFDIKGVLDGARISLNDSRITLDDTALAVGVSYKPATGGKPDVAIDLSASYLNLDDLMTRLQKGKKQAVQQSQAAPKDMKAALEPVRNFELPVNLTFDVSLQKARYNAMDASGIRLKGKSIGDTLTLETASAQNLLGATLSAKGKVASLKNLSGIDLDFYGKTDNVKAVMTALKQDTSKLPSQLSAAEVTANAKGTADALAFNANAKALSGSLDASGDAKGLLDTPTFDNLTVRLKHPNFVQAMQIVNPGFSGGPGMAKPVDFYARLVNDGKVYTLNDFKASLGQTTAGGDLRFDNSGAKPVVSGTLVLGDLPLDDLLGAKKSGGSGAGGSSASTGGERWSRNAFDMGWMHSANMDLAVSAKSITYGGWNFQNPKTRVTLNNGSLKVQDLNGGLFGGTAKLDASVQSPSDPKQPLTLSVDSAMQNVNLQQLTGALSSSNRIKASGTGSLTFDVSGAGISPNALVSSLKGKANLDASNAVFQGFDLAKLAAALLDSGKPLDRLQNAVGGATSSGQTRFDTIDGDYTINQGVVSIAKMQMTGPSATIDSTGSVSLPRWYIDTVHMIALANAKEVEPFRVEIKGPLDNPANTFGRGLFDEMLRRRAVDKIQEKLPDLLGDSATEKLQQLGILPQQQKKQAAPDAAPAPADAPQQQPKQQTPEDVLKDAIGGFLGR
jgi:uncharacterized protein involved in outer membrane biogenesis